MFRRVSLLFVFASALAASAVAQEAPQPRVVQAAGTPWTVSVVQTVDLQKLMDQWRKQNGARVGVAPSAWSLAYHVGTGLVIDGEGHVITRLAGLDPDDKDQKFSIAIDDGRNLAASLIGIDYPTGFAVLQVDALAVALPTWAALDGLANKTPVKIFATDVAQRTVVSDQGTKAYIATMRT